MKNKDIIDSDCNYPKNDDRFRKSNGKFMVGWSKLRVIAAVRRERAKKRKEKRAEKLNKTT